MTAGAMQRTKSARAAAVTVLALSLAGCINLAGKPPAALLTLTPTQSPPVGQTANSATTPTISVTVPVAPAAIATPRVPVQTSDTSIAYIKGAVWSEPPARLFARLMSDTIAARTGRVVLGYPQSLGSTGAQLSGELRSFGIDEATSSAVVVFEASLRRGEDRVYEKRRFEAREPVAAINAETVGPALNRAANRLADEVAHWVGR